MNINFGVVSGQNNAINPSKDHTCGNSGSGSPSCSYSNDHSHDRH